MTAGNTNELIKDEIWKAAQGQGYSRSDPRSAFVIAQRNPQGGWYINPAATYMDAERVGAQLKVRGVELYVVSANTVNGLIQVGDDRKFVHLA